MPYSVYIQPASQRQIEALPRNLQRVIVERLEQLSATPRPAGARPYKGLAHAYRLRIRDYRVIYLVDDQRQEVVVIRVGHRRDIYR